MSGIVDQYGPYPTDESQATAAAIYRHLLVSAYRRYRGIDDLLSRADADPDEHGPNRQTYMQILQTLIAEWSLLLALRLVMEQLPNRDDELAVHLWYTWEDGSVLGEWLYEWCREQGWDADGLSVALDVERSAEQSRAGERERRTLAVRFGGEQDRPRIVVLCGSSRFPGEYADAARGESRCGRIVLSAHEFGQQLSGELRAVYDELHRRQIDLADEVLVVSDASGYYGESTRGEIEYARGLGKPVRFLVGETSTL